MEKKPLISIITINKNNLQGLKRTLESVWGQTWTDFEQIVVDGASTDGSKEYLEENSHKISHWISEPDSGIYNAMNKGIKIASGEYLLFLNSGDELDKSEVLEDNHLHLKKDDIIYFNIMVKDCEGDWIKTCPRTLSFSYLCEDTLPHQSTFIKNTLFNEVGLYDESLEIVADWKFFILALCKYNATYKHVNYVITKFYFDGLSSQSQSWPTIVEERRKVLDSDFRLIMEDYKRLLDLRKIHTNLKASRKIQLLLKLKLLKKF